MKKWIHKRETRVARNLSEISEAWNLNNKQQVTIMGCPLRNLGGALVLWLVRSSPDRAVWVRALAEDIVLCS